MVIFDNYLVFYGRFEIKGNRGNFKERLLSFFFRGYREFGVKYFFEINI